MDHCETSKSGDCTGNFDYLVHKVLHAEDNAVSDAARFGKSLIGSHAYVTHPPCWKCAARLYQAGVVRIIYKGDPIDEDEYGIPIFWFNHKGDK
jgi:dCMP deaminase